jgi:hypothetical protein
VRPGFGVPPPPRPEGLKGPLLNVAAVVGGRDRGRSTFRRAGVAPCDAVSPPRGATVERQADHWRVAVSPRKGYLPPLEHVKVFDFDVVAAAVLLDGQLQCEV